MTPFSKELFIVRNDCSRCALKPPLHKGHFKEEASGILQTIFLCSIPTGAIVLGHRVTDSPKHR